MTPDTRPTCRCTALHTCAVCLAWAEIPRPWPRISVQGRRGRPRKQEPIAPAELRLRGLTHHYAPAATTPLLVPLGALEVAWL